MIGNDRNLIEELEKRLIWYRDEASEEEFDAEEVDAICTMLQKLSPIEEPHRDKEEAYQNIMRRIRREEAEGNGIDKVDKGNTDEVDENKANAGEAGEKSGKRKKRFFPERKSYRAAIIFVAVFAATILSLNMVTYARENKSLFAMILERVGLLKIVKENGAESGFDIHSNTNEVFYDSWAELDREVKSKIKVPEYIPDEYLLYGIKHYSYDHRDLIQADYYNKRNDHILIEITLWENEKKSYREMRMDEDGQVLLSEYSNENILYYAYEDEHICMIYMKKGFYRIAGNLTLEELMKVAEGIE